MASEKERSPGLKRRISRKMIELKESSIKPNWVEQQLTLFQSVKFHNHQMNQIMKLAEQKYKKVMGVQG